MRIKIGKTYIIEYGIILLFLLDICFWYIIPMETSFTGINNKKLMTIISMILTLDILFTTKVFRNKQYLFLNVFSILVFVQLFLLTIYSMNKYPAQGLTGTLAMAYYYLIFFSVYPMIYVAEKRGIDKFISALNIIAVILLLIIALQGVLYVFSGSVFMRGIINSTDVTMRNNRIRIGLTLLGNVFVIYNFSRIQIKKYNIINVIGFAFGMFDVLFIQMTRMYTLAIVGALLAVYLNSSKQSKRFIRIVIVSFGIVYLIFATNFVDSFIASFAATGVFGAGTKIRLEAIEYFWGYVRNNPFFGMGLVDQSNYFSVLYGNGGRYYLSDVGIVGLITQGGWTMATLYFIFLGRMVLILRKMKEHSNECTPLLWGLFIFTVLCTPTLVIWGRRTIIYVALVMTLFEYFYRHRVSRLEKGEVCEE